METKHGRCASQSTPAAPEERDHDQCCLLSMAVSLSFHLFFFFFFFFNFHDVIQGGQVVGGGRGGSRMGVCHVNVKNLRVPSQNGVSRA